MFIKDFKKSTFVTGRQDVDAFLGFFSDTLGSLVMTIGMLTMVVGLPSQIVFGRVLPGIGVGLIFGNLAYTWLAMKLAKQEGRTDVTALPSGIFTPGVVPWVLVIYLPVYLATKDPMFTWIVGVGATVIGGIVEIIGAIIGPWIRKNIPSVSMVGAIGGMAIVFLAGYGMLHVFKDPLLGLIPLAILLVGLIGKYQFPFKIPAGLLALAVGIILSLLLGRTELSVEGIGVHLPHLSIGIIGKAIVSASKYWMIIVPLQILNFITTLGNVEAASQVGDDYNIREAMLVDGFSTLLAGLFGSMFPVCVWVGHSGWKAVGGRMGYTSVSAVMSVLIINFGLITLISSLLPFSAIAGLIIFAGMVLGSQAFTKVPTRHAPIAVLAIIPIIMEFVKIQVDNTFSIFNEQGINFIEQLAQADVNYIGLSNLAQGSVIIAMLFSAIVAFFVDKKFKKAGIVAFVMSLLAFFGFIHSGTITWAASPNMAISYLFIMVFSFIMGTHQKSNKNELNIE